LFGTRIGGLRERDIGNEKMVGAEAGARLLQAREAAEKKARADQEKHGEGDLRGDEKTANAMLLWAGRGAARSFVERFAKIQFGGAERGETAEKKPGDDGDDECEGENPSIELNFKNVRNAAGGEAEERSERSPGKEESKRAAREGDEYAFR